MNAILRNLLILILIIVQTSVWGGTEKPTWLDQRPVSPFYYIGIGSAEKNSALDYRQIAKDNALQDLSSEIQVNISSEFIHDISEKAGIVEEDLRSQVRSATKAFLEGYEMAGAWEDETAYWVYYRLSKDVYEQKRIARRVNAVNLATDLFIKAEQKKKNLDASTALQLYIQGLGAMQEFLAEPLKAEINGQKILLRNEIFSATQDLLSQIELKSENARLSVKSSQALKEPLLVTAMLRDQSGNSHIIKNLPLYFSFIRGKGVLIDYVQTDPNGQARCMVSRVSAPDKLQIIQARVALNQLQPEPGKLSELTGNILNNLTLPNTRFILNVTGMTAFIQAQEQNLGKDLELLIIEPQLKDALAEKGFNFTDDMAQADILIELKARARKGAQVYSLFSAFVDVNISVIDLNSGMELYKKAFQNIKGIQLDFEKAGITALQAAGDTLKNKVPEIIKPLQK